MEFTKEDKEMVGRLLRGFENDLEELRNDRVGHSEIVSDLKESCREKISWLEGLQKRMEQEPESDIANAPGIERNYIDADLKASLLRLGIIPDEVRGRNVGASDYSQHIIQPWAIWQEYRLNPFDADIVKRVLRHKATDSRRMDYEKIIHICQERIRQIDYDIRENIVD